MENVFSRLLKVLSLERKQGYRNKAVIGGLDKFASRWEADPRATNGSPSLIGEIVALLIGYPSVDDTSARERIIDQIVRRAKEAEAMISGPSSGTLSSSDEAAASSEEPEFEPAGEGPGKDQVLVAKARGEAPDGPHATPSPTATRSGQTPAARGVESAKQRPPAGEGEPSPREAAPPRTKPALPKPERFPASQPESPAAASKQPAAEPVAPASPEGTPDGSQATPSMPAPSTPAEYDEQRPPEIRPVTNQKQGPEVVSAARGAKIEPAGDRDVLDGWMARREKRERPADAAEGALATAGRDPARLAPPAKDLPRAIATGEDAFDENMRDPGSEQTGPDDSDDDDSAPGSAGSRSMPARSRSTAGAAAGYGLNAPITRLPSVGPGFADKLAKLGVQTVHDLLYLLPRRYDDYSQLLTIDKLHYGEEVTIIGTVWQLGSRQVGDNRKMVTAVVGDGTGEIQMSWFNPFVERQLRVGRAYVFSGKIDSYRAHLLLRNPVFEPLDSVQINTGRVVPVYPLTQGLSGRWLRKVMSSAVTTWALTVPELLPASVRQDYGLMPIGGALQEIHFPHNNELLAAARRRLSFDELFFIQLGVLGYRQRFRSLTARPLHTDAETLAPYRAALPFDLTAAQERVLGDIMRDLAGAQPMSRLLQGDVGSGKTAVGAAALWAAVADGTQGAIMAPTEILAEQHARSFGRLFAGLARPVDGRPVEIALLTGRQRKSEREAVLAGLAGGQIDIVVGTHALIQEDVTFRELTVTVVDEQHRFGVEQRAALRQKGTQPHMLVMSATPIPRSLALTVFGDLDVSVIDEMPAGRIPTKTKWLTSTYRERAYNFIRRQVAAGHQAFIIYPLVEETGASEAKAAVEEQVRLQSNIFPDLRVGLLHGRMKGDDKDAVMRAFADGELQILVATSVVEVGIDVPNATVIVIEGAERFGLAQLHQFRGRVGRGAAPSYCVLVSDAAEGESTQRLQALESNNDGFALAQIDLDLRGPGDFLGTRQSGLPPLQLAQLSDLRTLEDARSAAQNIFAEDPELVGPEHAALAERVAEFWHGAGDVS